MALEIYFLLHCFSRLLRRLWAILAIQFSLRGGFLGGRFLLRGSCVFVADFTCSGQFVVCRNESRWVRITCDSGRWLGCPQGKQHSGLTELCLALWDCGPSTSLDRSVLAKGAEEMEGERVDMWTVVALEWICVLTRGPMFFLKAIYLSLTADSQSCQEERQVFSAGEVIFKDFNGKTYNVGQKSHLIALRS